MKFHSIVRISLIAIILGVGSLSHAVTARSASYSLEYSVVAMGGGISSSATYELVAYADESGSAAKASSSDYSVEPVVGAGGEAPKAGVSFWTLY